MPESTPGPDRQQAPDVIGEAHHARHLRRVRSLYAEQESILLERRMRASRGALLLSYAGFEGGAIRDGVRRLSRALSSQRPLVIPQEHRRR